MENIEIKRNQLRLKDAQREVNEINVAIKKRKSELEQLQINLAEAERVLNELNSLLEGKTYKGNT